MKPIRYKEFTDTIKALGGEFKRQKGSHQIWVLDGKTAVIPQHKEVSPGTIRDVCKALHIIDIDSTPRISA